jgi:hypothetical protein
VDVYDVVELEPAELGWVNIPWSQTTPRAIDKNVKNFQPNETSAAAAQESDCKGEPSILYCFRVYDHMGVVAWWLEKADTQSRMTDPDVDPCVLLNFSYGETSHTTP